MPMRAKTLCIRCNRIAVKNGRCEKHQRLSRQDKPRDNKWLYLYHSPTWLAMRAEQLAKEPLCRECLKDHVLTEATVADHIVPHKGDLARFFDATSLQSLCASCHNRKTSREDGGFNNPIK